MLLATSILNILLDNLQPQKEDKLAPTNQETITTCFPRHYICTSQRETIQAVLDRRRKSLFLAPEPFGYSCRYSKSQLKKKEWHVGHKQRQTCLGWPKKNESTNTKDNKKGGEIASFFVHHFRKTTMCQGCCSALPWLQGE